MPLLHLARRAVQRLGAFVADGRGESRGRQLARLLDTFGVDTVIGVGAHCCGDVTALRRAGYRGRIVSFEPLTGPRTELRRRSASDPDWIVLPYALGDRTGTVVVHGQTAEIRRLDDLWEQVVAPGARVFLTMDVPGHEGHVLRGAGRYAAECVGIRTGASFAPLHEDGLPFAEALALLQAGLGLTPVSVVPGSSDPHTGRTLRCDVVFFREEPTGDSRSPVATAQQAGDHG
ncbi:FkbM family methyltransferase [Streptomyces sp. NPDC057445]|uniref:FkbM family methyltransferase n=1 Tax=Streptomyces sp. NPDC057445 TaxID=3346136 RepID=UPI0036C1CCF2